MPWLDFDLGSGVAIDLPSQIIDATGIGEGRLGKACNSEELAIAAQRGPAVAFLHDPALRVGQDMDLLAAHFVGDEGVRQCCLAETDVAFRVEFQHRCGAVISFSAQFGVVGHPEACLPQIEHIDLPLGEGEGGVEEGRGGTRNCGGDGVAGGVVGSPNQPGWLGKSGPN